jgi:streptogramin lyase
LFTFRIAALIALLALALGGDPASAASYRVVHTHTGFGALFSLAADPRNNIYVTDQLHYAILKLSPSGHLLVKAALHQKCGISGVATTPSGDIFAVSNCESLVFHFSSAGRLLSRFGRISLLGPGANGVTANNHGTVFVAYSGPAGPVVRRGPKPKPGTKHPPLPPALKIGSTIREFTTTGALRRTIKLANIHRGFGIVVSRQGTLYVTADEGLLKISPTGRILHLWTQAAARTTLPIQPAVDDAGNVYAVTNAGSVLKISPGGQVLGTVVPHGTGLGMDQQQVGLEADHAGHLFVADATPNRIKEFSTSGKLLAIWTP